MTTVNNNQPLNELVKCCDCNNVHKVAERKKVKNMDETGQKYRVWDIVCPECNALDYYEL